jgi:hypothetical protein
MCDMARSCWLRIARLVLANTGAWTAFACAGECDAIKAVSASAQRDFVAHIVGEDPQHTERVDGEAVYHLARSPMPDLLRCDVAAPVLPAALECVPAETNLLPSMARSRTRTALKQIGACLHEPVVGPRHVHGAPALRQWFVTDWGEHWATRYRIVWSTSFADPAWTLQAVPLVDDNGDDIGRAARKQKIHERACGQMLAVVAAAQTDFRSTLGHVTEKGDDMSLFASSLKLLDFDVKVGVGGNTPNMLFAERVSSSVMNFDDAGRMGDAASRALSSCLQVRAERLADKVYPEGHVELIWRLTDRYATRPVLVFTVVRYEPATHSVSRTAIRVERQPITDD